MPAFTDDERKVAGEVLDLAARHCRDNDPFPRLRAMRDLGVSVMRGTSGRAIDNLSAGAATHIANNRDGVRDDITLELAAALVRTGWSGDVQEGPP